MAGENDPSPQDSVGNVTDEDSLIKLLDHVLWLDVTYVGLTRTTHHCHQ